MFVNEQNCCSVESYVTGQTSFSADMHRAMIEISLLYPNDLRDRARNVSKMMQKRPWCKTEQKKTL